MVGDQITGVLIYIEEKDDQEEITYMLLGASLSASIDYAIRCHYRWLTAILPYTGQLLGDFECVSGCVFLGARR